VASKDAPCPQAAACVRILDLLPVGVAQLDRTGRLVRANRTLLRLLDHPGDAAASAMSAMPAATDPTAGSLVARLGRFVAGVGERDALLARLVASAGTGAAGEPIELRLDDGREFQAQVSRLGEPGSGSGSAAAAAADAAADDDADAADEDAGFVVVITEVTAERRLRAEAVEQAERYRVLADHVGDVVLVHRGRRVEWASPSVLPVLGVAPEALVGRELEEFAHPDDVRNLPVLVPGGPTQQHRLRLRHPRGPGGYRWFAATISGRWDGDLVAEVYVSLHDIQDQVVAEQAVARNGRRLRLVFDASTDGYAVYEAVRGPDGAVTSFVLISMNVAGLAAVGRTAAEVLGLDVRQIVPPPVGDAVHARMLALLERGELPGTRHVVPMGARDLVIDGSLTLLDPDLVLSTWRDVTDAVEGERLLERAYDETAEMRATLQTALDATSDGFAVYRLEFDDQAALTGLRVVHANAAGAQSLGLDPAEMVDLELHEFLPDVERMGLWDRIVDAAATKAPQQLRIHVFSDGVTGPDRNGGPGRNGGADPTDGPPDGSTGGEAPVPREWQSSWDYAVAPVGEERMAITWRDVSAEEGALRQLARHRDEAMHSATHDALTGLPNRTLLLDHLRAALVTCRPDERVGIVFVDLDHFKAINDTHGHAAGDAVLRATAERLNRLVRHGDLAARLAGDEFVLVLTQLAAQWTADHFFARASALLAEPLVAEGVELHPSASLGVVLADPSAGPVDVDALIKDADTAMYEAKAVRRVQR